MVAIPTSLPNFDHDLLAVCAQYRLRLSSQPETWYNIEGMTLLSRPFVTYDNEFAEESGSEEQIRVFGNAQPIGRTSNIFKITAGRRTQDEVLC